MIRSHLVVRRVVDRHAQALCRRAAEKLRDSFLSYSARNSNRFDQYISRRDHRIFANNTQTVDFHCVWRRRLFSDCVSLSVFSYKYSMHTFRWFPLSLKIHCNRIGSINSYFSWELDNILWENPLIRDSVIYVTLWELMRSQLYANADFSHAGTESAKQ